MWGDGIPAFAKAGIPLDRGLSLTPIRRAENGKGEGRAFSLFVHPRDLAHLGCRNRGRSHVSQCCGMSIVSTDLVAVFDRSDRNVESEYLDELDIIDEIQDFQRCDGFSTACSLDRFSRRLQFLHTPSGDAMLVL